MGRMPWWLKTGRYQFGLSTDHNLYICMYTVYICIYIYLFILYYNVYVYIYIPEGTKVLRWREPWGWGGVGWGGVGMLAFVVTLSWKLMLREKTLGWGGVGEVKKVTDPTQGRWKHKKDLTVRPPHFCDLANSLQITLQNWPQAKSLRKHSTYERLLIQKRFKDGDKSQLCSNKCNFDFCPNETSYRINVMLNGRKKMIRSRWWSLGDTMSWTSSKLPRRQLIFDMFTIN